MVSQRKRRLFFGLGLAVALALAVPASASAVSTLTGEGLSGTTSGSASCGTSTYSASGTSTGPYPGTFTESGSWPFAGALSATFTITSGSTTITGSKSAPSDSTACGSSGGAPFAIFQSNRGSYTATIHTPNGNFHDEGATTVVVGINVNINRQLDPLTESFTSSLTAPVLIAPTSKDQCKNDGWKAFPQFQNQGQCVSSVQSQRPS